ncbi:hypothetical protein THAOC_18131 [Thalassiosira oceanica]|uniref:Uncharacterized protein n=1 Tax=Thalassiosira oceanica TaxID=159749 RepID=K0SSY0_THAOC|nr:hypothetical protein THAOC_18131 [Thalassiosira oceanica]|eukprot:EJK61392.1 hypothetical protein THAOC_18131 [Thalassiosira oceanica]
MSNVDGYTPKGMEGEGSRTLTLWIRSEARLALAFPNHAARSRRNRRRRGQRARCLTLADTRSRRKLSHKEARPLSSLQTGFGGLLEMKTTHRQRCLKRRMNSSQAKEEPNQMDLARDRNEAAADA